MAKKVILNNPWQSYELEINSEIRLPACPFSTDEMVWALVDRIYREMGELLEGQFHLTTFPADPSGYMLPARIIVSRTERKVIVDTLTPEIQADTDKINRKRRASGNTKNTSRDDTD